VNWFEKWFEKYWRGAGIGIIALMVVALIAKFGPVFGRLLTAWTLFVFAVVNIANVIVRYTQHYEDSYGLGATLKMVIWGAALAGWSYLLFY
jgi:hypothetical protein